jgi:hypothetical protein
MAQEKAIKQAGCWSGFVNAILEHLPVFGVFLYDCSMKLFNLLICLLFVFSAALQYNDPDPYLWIPIYMYGAVICWLAFRDKFYPKAYLFGIIVFPVYAVYLFFAKDGVLDWINKHKAEDIAATMKAQKPWIEVAREFFGLVILIVVLTINFFYSGKRRVTS